MALIDEIRRKNPSLSNRSDEEIKSVLRQSPEFQYFSDDEFESFVSGAGQPEEQSGTPGFTGGLSAGVDQMQAMGGGLIMAAGEAMENEDVLNAGRDIYSRNMDEAGQNDLGYGFTDIRSAGDAWNWARYTAGNMLPMLATSAVSGGVGGAVAGTGAKLLAGQAAKQAAVRGGQALGATLASTGMEAGSMMGETEDLDVSLAHGALAGSLDAITPVRLLRGAGRHELANKAADEISDGVLSSLRKQAGRSAAGAAGRGSLTNLMTEASTEGLQGLINQHASYWVENNGESLLNNLGEVDFKAIVDEAAAGGLMGGLAGAPTGIAERGQARSQVQRIDAAREQAAAQGGDALDQTMAAQEAEQEAASQPDPAFDQPLGDITGNMEAAQNQPYNIRRMGRNLAESESAAPVQPEPLSERVGTEQTSNVVYQQDGVTVTRDADQQFSATLEGSDLQAYGRDPGEARRRLSQLSERNQPQAPVLQNRDRSDPGYVQQMEAIASDPDYDQVSASKTPDAGAPMVFAQGRAPVIEDADTGRQETITMADGQGGTRKIRAQYAVVEAGNLKASHRADGSQNADYGRDGLIALNNGRTAGLQEAYNRGTADTYRQNLREDARALGIDPAAIDSKQQPVLVRLFDGTQLEGIDDPGAASNERLSADLSPSEQAQTDARRITPDVLATLQAGDPTGANNSDFVRSALSAIAGDNRKTDMRDRNGLLTAAGQKRIRSALVERAYSDETLTQELAEATDNDLKTLGDALTESAGRWALMRERAREGSINQDMDITDTLVSAVNMIRKSRQEGRSLKDIADQVDAFAGEADQMAVHMLHLFYHGSNYNRIRAKDTIAGALQGYVESALQTSPAPDMFGQMASPQDALEAQRGQTEGTQPQATAPRVQPDGTDNREAGQAGERPGRDQGRAQDAETGRGDPETPELTLQAQTEQDLAEQEQQRQQTEQEAAARRREEEQRAQADAEADDFVLSGSDSAIDQAEARGQGNMFDQPAAQAQQEGSAQRPAEAATGASSLTWKKDSNRKIWRSNDGQIITDESFGVGGNRIKFFPVYANDAERGAGNNYTSGESLAEAKSKAAPQQEPAQPEIPEASPKQGTAPSQPIEDFGEKIEGARKDYASKLQDAKAKDTAAVPLSESWPEPDYQKLLDSGADPEAVGFAHAARDEVPPKPRKGWKLKGWTRQVEALRNFTESVIEGEFNVDDMREFARKDGYRALEQHVFNRADLYAAVGHEKSLKGLRFFSAHYSMFDGEKGSFDKWVIERTAKTGAFGNMPRRLVAADSRQEAIDKFREVHESLGQKEKAGKNVRFDIYSSRRDSKDIFIGKKIGGDVVRIQEGFTSLKEARAYLQDNQAELEDWLAKMKQIPNHRKESNAPRVGKDHRNGGDVTPDAFAETFGFRGVQFGNYVEQGRRQQDLNDAYDGLMDLAGILNVPARALSLNGELGLAFGARGKGGKRAPKAHYERHNIVINLTKKDGAGSLAHEWFHSLDNYFSRERGGSAKNAMATEGNAAANVRPEVAEAFRNVRRAVNHTKLKQRSQKLDKVRTKAYWSTDPEMTARAFESYVIEKLRDQGASNDYLANIVSEEYWEASEALGMQDSGSYPYPEAAEIPEIRAAYDNLFEVIETREDDAGNVAMFSRAAQTDTEAFREWFGDSKVVDGDGAPKVVYHGSPDVRGVINGGFSASPTRGEVFFFTDSNAVAETYADDSRAFDYQNAEPHTLPVYLSIENPYVVDAKGAKWRDTERHIKEARDGGHDGVIILNSRDEYNNTGNGGRLSTVYAAFKPTQVKSAATGSLRSRVDGIDLGDISNTGAFDPTNPDIRYSQPDRTGYRRTPNTRVQSMSAPEARRIANVLMKKWKGRPPMIVAEEIAEFPLELQAAIYQAGAQNDMRAVFWDNKVFVLAPRIPNRRALEEVILHETIGHYGLRKMMGDNLKMLLERVYRDLGDSRQAEQLKQTYFGGNFNARNQEHRLTIAEELIAHLAESGKHQYRTLLERILTVVRNSLRRMGFTIEITERDLLALLDGADKVVRNGGISVPSSADIHFSRADYENARNGVDSGVENNDAPPLPDVEEITDDSETQRILDRYEQRKSQSEVRRTTVGGGQARADWHRETKIRVSEEQPDVFFRGAAQQLTPEDFSAARRGYNTRHPSAALGTFFTNSDQDAARYGSVYPYNLDLRNPFVVKGEDLPPFNDPAEAEQYRADIEAEGYDGILIDYTDLGGPQHIVPFEPESVLPINETPMFSRVGNRLESAEDHFEDLTAAQRTALGKIAPRTPSEKATEWLSERLDRWATKLRQGIVDRFAALKELDENLYGRDVVESSTASSSWVLAQMSGAASGALQTMLTAGRLKFNQEQKVIGIRDGGAQGLNDVLKKLGSAAEIERFFGWIAGNRSKRLLAEGRENLFEPDEVEALATLNRGRTEGGKSRAALYREVFKEFQQYRDDVLEIAEQTGTITAEQRQTWANEFYVPFYRLADNEGGFTGPKASGGISRQEAYKRLKGGSQNLNDLLENTMMNFHHLLQTSLKNQAALQAMDNAQELGIAREVREADRNTENSTFVLRDGQKIWYEIDDPLVFKAVTALAHPGMNSAAMKVMRGFKRLFTNMTTTTPQFVVANLLRDSMQASATSEVSKNFMRNIAEGTKAYGDRRTRARMMASGGSFSFGHLYGENADEMRLQLTGELSRADILRQPSMVPNAMRLMWRKWNDMTDFTENVNRAAIFEQNVESRGELYAAFKARDLMNFSQHGAWPAVRILIDIVPFLNARLQGLDKIYRSGVKPGILSAMGKGTVSDKQAAQRFWTVTGAITMATIALYLNNEDDEEYAKLEDWQKDTYWFFRVSEDHAIFIPKPFEVGAIATLAERITEQAVSDTATGELFKERLMHMVMDTFSFSPVPQAFQPALDVYANYDAFTGRPIENMGMQRLSPELRRRNSTTMPADVGSAISRGLSSVWGGEGLSPIQVDHLIQGYFGAVGSWGAGIADTIWRTANGETSPDRRWYEFQPVRRFYSNLGDEDRYTRYGTLFYESLKETRRVYADIKEYQELGQMAEARKLAQENATSLRYRTTLNRMQRKLSKLNKSMQQIQRMDASSEYKRRELDRIRAIKNRMLETIGQRLERINADE